MEFIIQQQVPPPSSSVPGLQRLPVPLFLTTAIMQSWFIMEAVGEEHGPNNTEDFISLAWQCGSYRRFCTKPTHTHTHTHTHYLSFFSSHLFLFLLCSFLFSHSLLLLSEPNSSTLSSLLALQLLLLLFILPILSQRHEHTHTHTYTHTYTHTHNHTRFWPNSQNTATLHTFLHTYPPVHSWWFAQVIAVVERLENKLPLSLPGWLTSTSFQNLSLSLLFSFPHCQY